MARRTALALAALALSWHRTTAASPHVDDAAHEDDLFNPQRRETAASLRARSGARDQPRRLRSRRTVRGQRRDLYDDRRPLHFALDERPVQTEPESWAEAVVKIPKVHGFNELPIKEKTNGFLISANDRRDTVKKKTKFNRNKLKGPNANAGVESRDEEASRTFILTVTGTTTTTTTTTTMPTPKGVSEATKKDPTRMDTDLLLGSTSMTVDPKDGDTTPSSAPSAMPSISPTGLPSAQPTGAPTTQPSVSPTGEPTGAPVILPDGHTAEPSSTPSVSPTDVPSSVPTTGPTASPSSAPSSQPSAQSDIIVAIDGTITRESNSKVVTLPEPPEPTVWGLQSDGVGCPHHRREGVLNWHDIDTDVVPGLDVNIPPGATVLISASVQQHLGVVHIPPSSELILGSDTEDHIELHVNGMVVEGKLTIGSETCRLDKRVTITLHGRRPLDVSTLIDSDKGIDVTGGTISMHGKRYFHTWSRLAMTVEVGGDAVYLQNKVNWEPGQEIVIVTSAIKDSRDYHQNEVRTIRSVDINPRAAGVGSIVYFTEPAKFRHLATELYQVEVGLLTRTVKIQGAEEDSEPTDPDPLTCMTPRSDPIFIQSSDTQPCTDTALTGFGAHIIVHNGGKGYVEGVELFRVGQTNVMGKYPMHFHLLGESCPDCYLKDSSVHRSYYRCISIHATNNATVSENVAYDVSGFAFYLEDGVEENNSITFNLAAHIHTIGPIPWGEGQRSQRFRSSKEVLFPGDVSSSGFYISNVHNDVIGNAASGGWAGFAFPLLNEPIGVSNHIRMKPSSALALKIDGNTAHSTGWWWSKAGGFYFGGAVYYNSQGTLEYNPAREMNRNRGIRDTCRVNPCNAQTGNCDRKCPDIHQTSIRLTNTKTFLSGGAGLNSWSGRMDIDGFESHDNRIALESLTNGGFYVTNMLTVCRTGEDLGLPEIVKRRNRPMLGSGFNWYDTGQKNIITNSVFRHCGYRSPRFDQYDADPRRGCDDADRSTACHSSSSVFGFTTHSDQFAPEIMQATRNITFDKCGRRFRFLRDVESVSSRMQNWIDADGSVTGLNETAIIASGIEGSRDWWEVDDKVVFDPQGPLRFIKTSDGPKRAIGYIKLSWDKSIHDQVGRSICGIAGEQPCRPVGRIRHIGRRFFGGIPITANPEIPGMTGGFGWLLTFQRGAPRQLTISRTEIDPDSLLLLHIPYPKDTIFDIRAGRIDAGCKSTAKYTCNEKFLKVDSVEEVRDGPGNLYYVDPDTGVLTIRVVQVSAEFAGNPEFVKPDYDTPGRWRTHALARFERDGVLLPQGGGGNYHIAATNCGGDDASGPYCTGPVESFYDPDVCPAGFEQMAYDKCCRRSDRRDCVFADGSKNY